MLHDPKREAEIAEQLFDQSLEGWQRYLLTTADVLQTYGWVQRQFGCKEFGFCFLGANSHTFAVLRDLGVAATDILVYDQDRALTNLETYIQGEMPGDYGVVSWNDNYCKSKEQIIYTCQLVALGG